VTGGVGGSRIIGVSSTAAAAESTTAVIVVVAVGGGVSAGSLLLRFSWATITKRLLLYKTVVQCECVCLCV